MAKDILIKVDTHPFDDELKLYKRKDYVIKPGLTSLVGCNGSGKTTFLDDYLMPYLKKNNIACLDYNDRRTGGTGRMEKLLFDGKTEAFASMYVSSEGERIVCGLDPIFGSLKSFFNKNRGNPVFLVFDAIDSGMSIDEIIEIRELFLDLVFEEAKNVFGVDLYMVIAANNYEWCNDPRIHNVDITNGKEIEIKSYDDFKKAITATRDFKDKCREALSSEDL